MKHGLTETTLQRELDQHRDECGTCGAGFQCDAADRIESSFWNEVDRRIDDAKDARAERGER